MLSSLETFMNAGAFVFTVAGAKRYVLLWSGAYRPAGVGEHVQMGIEVSQELGRSYRLHGGIPAGDTG